MTANAKNTIWGIAGLLVIAGLIYLFWPKKPTIPSTTVTRYVPPTVTTVPLTTTVYTPTPTYPVSQPVTTIY